MLTFPIINSATDKKGKRKKRDKKQVKIVKRLIKNVFESFTGYITSLYIGEFYPTQIIYHEELKSNQQNILQQI